MRITINSKEVIFPSSLSEITLGQRIDFHNQHGKLLDQMLDSIMKMDDEIFKEVELAMWHTERMYRTFAFFAGVTVEAIKESEFIDQVARIYHSCLSVLMDEEKEIQLQREFVWKDQQWELAPPELKQGDRMKFGEFVDAKQIIQDMVQLGRGKWEYLIRLCAIYLRKKGEPYSEEFVYEDSERLKLMKELPMDIALQVGFFLNSCQNISINILTSFESRGQRVAAVS